MAAIAAVNMEPQWALHQPFVPYVYGAYYPAYHQVRVVPWTNPVGVANEDKDEGDSEDELSISEDELSLGVASFPLTYSQNISAEQCEVLESLEKKIRKGIGSDFKRDRKNILFLHFRSHC